MVLRPCETRVTIMIDNGVDKQLVILDRLPQAWLQVDGGAYYLAEFTNAAPDEEVNLFSLVVRKRNVAWFAIGYTPAAEGSGGDR